MDNLGQSGSLVGRSIQRGGSIDDRQPRAFLVSNVFIWPDCRALSSPGLLSAFANDRSQLMDINDMARVPHIPIAFELSGEAS